MSTREERIAATRAAYVAVERPALAAYKAVERPALAARNAALTEIEKES